MKWLNGNLACSINKSCESIPRRMETRDNIRFYKIIGSVLKRIARIVFKDLIYPPDVLDNTKINKAIIQHYPESYVLPEQRKMALACNVSLTISSILPNEMTQSFEWSMPSGRRILSNKTCWQIRSIKTKKYCIFCNFTFK